eukprot:g4786.t1
MEDRPMHGRGRGGGRRTMGSDVGGGKHSATVDLSVRGKSRVASLFDLLQELSVPPKSQSSSHGSPRSPGVSGAIPPTAVSSPSSSASASMKRLCPEGTKTLGQSKQKQQRAQVMSQERRKQAAGGSGRGPDGGGVALRSGSTSGSGQQQQQKQQKTLATCGGSDSLGLPPRSVLRTVRHGHNQQDVSPPPEPTRRVSFVEGSDDARRLKNGGGSPGAWRGHDRAARASNLARALGAGGGSIGSTTTTNPGEGCTHQNAEPSPTRDTTTAKRKSASLGTVEQDSSNSHRVMSPVTRQPRAAAGEAAAAARAAAAAGSTTTTQTGQEEGGSRDGRTVGQVDNGARRGQRAPQEEDDALLWMTQEGDPTEAVAVDHQGHDGSPWQSLSTPSISGDLGRSGRDRSGAKASKHTVLQQQHRQEKKKKEEEEEEEEEERVTVGGSSSDHWMEAHSLRRCSSRPDDKRTRGRRGAGQGAGGQARWWLRPSSSEASPPGRATGEGATQGVEAADDDDGITSSSGDEGYTHHHYGGDDNDERGAGGASDRVQEERKELLGVRGLCLMKGTLLAMVDWSTAEGGTERSIMPTSKLKAQWPRQYIAYLETKVVFSTEDGGTAPDTRKDCDAG